MELLRGWRVRRFLSQQALAERAGVRTTTVQRLEQGTEWPRPTTVGKLCQALDCTLEELLSPTELAAATTPPRPAQPVATSAGAQDRDASDAEARALVCMFDGQPLDTSGDCWHVILADDDPEAPARVAHLQCWQGAQPRPQVAPCCRKNGACGQRWG